MQSDLSLQELKVALSSTDPEWQNPTWLDVRTSNEVTVEGMIDQAIHIEVTTLAGRLEELEHLKEQRILCYCRSGGRSHNASQLLKQNGFSLAINVGGFDDIKDAF